ncbi:Ferric enterobactin transport system permease protein FepG [Paraconexibacter sp. AEG42_29]|uniref:Ferric enterobactin transport system permease protein FepG n=1 Tax=Paraconexibacter sp. AEG42_29 TaxID=2997339 RepID=A0AAU7AUC9_9ACTN
MPGLGRTVRLPVGGIVVRIEPRSIGVVLVLTAILLVLLVLAVGTGEFSIPPGEVIDTLLGGGDQSTRFIIETLRLPRAITAILVGAALGASGAIFQSLTRNPLGSPDIIGFVQGASAAAVFEIIVIGGGTFAIAAGSVVGGLLTAVLVYGLAYRGGVQGYRLILIGIGISAMLVATTDFLLSRSTLEEAQVANIWITGSLNGRGWEHVRPVAAAMAVLLPLVALLAGPLRMIELGDDAAHALGVNVERTRLALLVVGVGLCAVATASAGPIVFVALAAPQISRRLTRAAGPGVGAALVMGAVLLLGADVASQKIFTSTQLPVGVMTGAAGGVYLIWLLTREWRKGTA